MKEAVDTGVLLAHKCITRSHTMVQL